MRVLSSSLFFSLLTLFLFGPIAVKAQNFSCNTASVLKKFLDEKHVNPEALHENFSGAVSLSLMLSLDANALIFTKADVENELKDVNNLEWVIEEGTCSFLETLNSFLRVRLVEMDSALQNLAFTQVMEARQFSSDFFSLEDLADDQATLQSRWTAYIKKELLERKYLRSSPSELAQDNLEELFASVVETERCNISKKLVLLEENTDFISKAFFKAMARAYDPHTNYYNYGFMELLSAFMEEDAPSFGFKLIENRFGQISVAKLLPGGPAWRSNQLHVGDIIKTISLDDGTEVDLTCRQLEEVERLVRRADQSAELTIINRTQEQKRVKLVKEKVASTENAVRGYVLKGDKTIGYIALPDFYTSEGEKDEERGCARDVAREIIKLNRDHIEGLIIDLRDNGGGSLQEALDLIGIFIEEGPLALMQKEGKIKVIGDRSRGAAYFGPLVVMVNGQSASASELLAASLQDYNRALIVGDTTFGKAVGQEIEVVGAFLSENDKDPDLQPAIAKITTSRLFRLKGQSYQQEGVVPDIYIPELLVNSTRSEATYPFAIKRQDIERDTYFKPYPELPVTDLAALQKNRLNSSGFARARVLTDSLVSLTVRLKELSADSFLKVRELRDKKEAMLISIRDSEGKPFQANNHAFDKTIISIDSKKKQIESMTLRNLENNLYVRQAYAILSDLINSTN